MTSPPAGAAAGAATVELAEEELDCATAATGRGVGEGGTAVGGAVGAVLQAAAKMGKSSTHRMEIAC